MKIDPNLNKDAIQILVENGLGTGVYKKPCMEWAERREKLFREIKTLREGEKSAMDQTLTDNEPVIRRQLMAYLVGKILDYYP